MAHPTICFAHAAYRLADEYRRRGLPGPIQEVRTFEELRDAAGQVDVLVVSGLWRNELLNGAPKLRFVQSVSAGTDQFSRELFAARGIRLASGQGANERAVAEHAIALILALVRHLGRARDDQRERRWSGMIGDPALRQDELAGKTLVIVGLGRIGSRLARLARAFDMRVVGIRRSPKRPDEDIDDVLHPDRLPEALAAADVLAVTCPLTPETEGLIGRAELAMLRPTAYLVNVSRGRVVDEAALVSALGEGRLAGAGLDVFREEPLPSESPLWQLGNVLVTPHSAGETARYEANVIDLLTDNLGRLARGEPLRNEIV